LLRRNVGPRRGVRRLGRLARSSRRQRCRKVVVRDRKGDCQERSAEASAAEAGVDVTLEIGEGLPHVYQILLGTPEAAEATERIGKFLRARVH